MVRGAVVPMDVVLDTRRGMPERAAALKDSEPNFARFMLAMVNATETDDLSRYSPSVLEALLRKTYTRLGKREGRSHVVFEFPPDDVVRAEMLEVFSADMPFIVDSVLAAIRAKGGVIRFMSHPVLHLDPESHRVLDEEASVSINESLLMVHIEPVADPEQKAAILAEIDGTLTEVYRATRAWRTMLERVRRLVEEWKLSPPKAPAPAIAEAKEFRAWLAEHNFTFLGMREYRLDGEGADARLVPLVTTGIGLLED
jgi:glutamate dehydrogenase